MRVPLSAARARRVGLLAAAVAVSAFAQSFLSELKSEHDPVRRAELALSLADESFEAARDLYQKGSVHEGDVALENMTSALNACLDSLAVANKTRFYKKAELKVAMLQRRLSGLTEGLSILERGWAEQTARKIEEIHDKLLSGVMRK